MSATPTVRSHLADGGAVRKAESRGGELADKFPLCINEQDWPLHRYAAVASMAHLILLALSVLFRFAVTPAQASAGAVYGSAMHLGLLVFSGTAAAIFMLAATRQSAFVRQRQQQPDQSAKARGSEAPTILAAPRMLRPMSPPMSPRSSASPVATQAAQSPMPAGRTENTAPEDWAELMARASHELRTPLNAVIGFSDVMQRELLGPIAHERYREYITHIRDSGFALLKSTEDTLALTNLIGQSHAAQIDATELGPILRQAWLAVPHQAVNPNIELLSLGSDNPMVHCNKAALRQAMVNLFTHAITMATPGSAIQLQTIAKNNQVTLVLSCQQTAQAEPAGKASHISSARQDCPSESGLAIAMARALLQLQGAQLHITPGDEAQWSASIELNGSAS